MSWPHARKDDFHLKSQAGTDSAPYRVKLQTFPRDSVAENVDCDREGDTWRQVFQNTKELQHSEAIPSLKSKTGNSHWIKH